MNSIHYKGNQDLIDEDAVALFCSRSIPLSLYYPLLDFFKVVFNEPITLASGWHSTIEKKALKTRKPLSNSNIIYYLAKGMNHFEAPDELRADFDKGKLLIVSLWLDEKRIDKNKAQLRNELIFKTYDNFFFLNIHEGGTLEKFYHKCVANEKKVYLFNHFTNAKWRNENIIWVDKDNLRGFV